MKSRDNDFWISLGWATVGGARFTHTWRYHPRNGLLQSGCRAVLRHGLVFELLKPETDMRCKICEKRNEVQDED